MGNLIRHLGIFFTVILTCFSCSKPPSEASNSPPPPVLLPVESKTEPQLPFLAQIETLKNRADIRVRDEVVWKSADNGSKFYRFDALQTHESAEARVRYESGSRLELKEKTLIIFDKDPGYTEKSVDRALLKSGKITGIAKKELWVFTNAGLIKLKPRKEKEAQAVLAVSDNNQLKVSVQAGTVDLITKNEAGTYQKIVIPEKSNYALNTRVDLGVVGDQPNSENIKSLSNAVPTETKPEPKPAESLSELVIDSPADNAVTDQPVFEISGRLTSEARLLIDGKLISVAPDLSFKKQVTLIEGPNLVVFQLIRSDSTVKFYRRTVQLRQKK